MFYPPEGEQRSGNPRGPNLRSFSFISHRKLFFWVSIYRRNLPVFDPQNFLSPGGWPTKWDPKGSQFEIFQFYIDVFFLSLPRELFFGFQFTGEICPFLTPGFFYPPEGEQRSRIPRGRDLRSFCFISLREPFFLGLNFGLVIGLFWPVNFFIPRRWTP